MRRQYQFALLRYVHNQAAAEFLNVGVVLWVPDTHVLRFQFNQHYGRASSFFDGFDGSTYRKAISGLTGQFSTFSAVLARGEETSLFTPAASNLVDVLRKLLPSDSSAFQWSHVMSGIAVEPEARLDGIYQEFVARHDQRTKSERRVEAAIWSDVEHSLRSLKFVSEGKVKFDVTVKSRNLEHQFHAGWKNGVTQLLEPIAFDYSDPADVIEKAVKWHGRLTLLAEGLDFRLTAVVSAPRDAAGRKAFTQAQSILRDTDLVREIVPEQEFARVVPVFMARDLEDHAEA